MIKQLLRLLGYVPMLELAETERSLRSAQLAHNATLNRADKEKSRLDDVIPKLMRIEFADKIPAGRGSFLMSIPIRWDVIYHSLSLGENGDRELQMICEGVGHTLYRHLIVARGFDAPGMPYRLPPDMDFTFSDI